ncbi:sugar kinase [Simiduia curdlanivorans]|uniref:Sugar kinase n=1 Tax=Simiduia curdlanivorans TaxID=1492769 RepID=A0ABV8V379_9GAMM|nr:sugar kinase [Simiduia curdlanivorans]MDN3637545.1 sugar kinase [Simiduia curdlanivorans]
MYGIAAIGEVMIELAPAPQDLKRLAYAGDTYNTAIYLARAGAPTSYVTHLGQDSHSDAILAELSQEQVATNLIKREPTRQPGLYIIHNRPDGEREFAYWRDHSAARLLFNNCDPDPSLLDMQMIYLSGISIAIISPEARERLHRFLSHYQQKGGKVVFDSNFRPRLWPDLGTAQATTERFLKLADIALLTLEDEQALWNEQDQDVTMARLLTYALPELVVKRGALPALVVHENTLNAVDVCQVKTVIDTTAAGDSFNAGYLAARYRGLGPELAVSEGARCAAAVIQHRGAIVPLLDYQASLAALERHSQNES